MSNIVGKTAENLIVHKLTTNELFCRRSTLTPQPLQAIMDILMQIEEAYSKKGEDKNDEFEFVVISKEERNEWQQKAEHLNAQILSLQKQSETKAFVSDQAIQDLQRRLESYEAEFETQQLEMDEIKKSAEEGRVLRADVVQLQSTRDSLIAQVRELEDEIARVASTRHQLQVENSLLCTEIVSNEEALETLINETEKAYSHYSKAHVGADEGRAGSINMELNASKIGGGSLMAQSGISLDRSALLSSESGKRFFLFSSQNSKNRLLAETETQTDFDESNQFSASPVLGIGIGSEDFESFSHRDGGQPKDLFDSSRSVSVCQKIETEPPLQTESTKRKQKMEIAQLEELISALRREVNDIRTERDALLRELESFDADVKKHKWKRALILQLEQLYSEKGLAAPKRRPL